MKTNKELREEGIKFGILRDLNSLHPLVSNEKFRITEKFKPNSSYLYLVLMIGLFIYFSFFNFQKIISVLSGIGLLIGTIAVIFHFLNSKYNYTHFDYVNHKVFFRSRFFDKEKELKINENSSIKFKIEEIGSDNRYYCLQLHIEDQLILDYGNRYESDCEKLKKIILKIFRDYYGVK